MHSKSIRTSMFSLVAAGVLAAVPALASAQKTVAPQREGETREVQLHALPTDGKMANLQDIVGKPVADFTLTDSEGNTHTLSEYLSDGKIVVLEWINPRCPVCDRVYKSGIVKKMIEELRELDEEVVYLTINSQRAFERTAQINEGVTDDHHFRFRQRPRFRQGHRTRCARAMGARRGGSSLPDPPA